jgi:hypothetical protein
MERRSQALAVCSVAGCETAQMQNPLFSSPASKEEAQVSSRSSLDRNVEDLMQQRA